jgi:hypothetical protein
LSAQRGLQGIEIIAKYENSPRTLANEWAREKSFGWERRSARAAEWVVVLGPDKLDSNKAHSWLCVANLKNHLFGEKSTLSPISIPHIIALQFIKSLAALLSTESRELFFGAREIRQRSSGKEEGKKLNEINFPLSISKMRFRFLFGYGMIHILLVAASFRLGRLDRPQRSRVRIAGEVFFFFLLLSGMLRV